LSPQGAHLTFEVTAGKGEVGIGGGGSRRYGRVTVGRNVYVVYRSVPNANRRTIQVCWDNGVRRRLCDVGAPFSFPKTVTVMASRREEGN
jgi:hypothetical protein